MSEIQDMILKMTINIIVHHVLKLGRFLGEWAHFFIINAWISEIWYSLGQVLLDFGNVVELERVWKLEFIWGISDWGSVNNLLEVSSVSVVLLLSQLHILNSILYIILFLLILIFFEPHFLFRRLLFTMILFRLFFVFLVFSNVQLWLIILFIIIVSIWYSLLDHFFCLLQYFLVNTGFLLGVDSGVVLVFAEWNLELNDLGRSGGIDLGILFVDLWVDIATVHVYYLR